MGRPARVAVVVPYFQRKAGVLTGALASIAAQRASFPLEVTVYIANDASPLRPEADIAAAALPSWVRVKVIDRENGGPSAARNTSLDAVEEDMEIIAFIDSDDRWAPDHLERGVVVLRGGADFYFTDHEPLAETGSYFKTLSETSWREDGGKIAVDPCGLPARLAYFGGRRLVADTGSGVEDVFDFTDADAIIPLCQEYIAHTSTMIISKAALGEVRFNESVRAAGEDFNYTCRLAVAARRVSFSSRVGCRQSEGVNIFMNAISFDSPNNVRLMADNLYAALALRSDLAPFPEARALLEKKIRSRMEAFAWVWARGIFVFRRLRLRELWPLIRTYPLDLAAFPFLIASFPFRRLLGLPIASA